MFQAIFKTCFSYVLVRKATIPANMLKKYIFKLSRLYNISGLGIVVFMWFQHSNWKINNV
jgi:hypothetical protein